MITHADSQTHQAPPSIEDPRWQAVLARDAAADGTFYYSVKTTGVYCFPSCAARTPRPENVRFHATRENAEAAGFRPCKRCKPDAGGGRRQRAAAGEIQFTVIESSLGMVLVAHGDRGLVAVLFGDDEDSLRWDLERRFPGARLVEGNTELRQLAGRVAAFIESPARGLDVPVDLRGTEFQRAVWHALLEIPPGSTASYSDIAVRLGAPNAARAVAQACAANALAVVVPCHRVRRGDGSLSGYRWGTERKRILLEREAVA